MPNLMQILLIFLKLQAVKQSGPGLLAYPVHIISHFGDETRDESFQSMTCTSTFNLTRTTKRQNTQIT